MHGPAEERPPHHEQRGLRRQAAQDHARVVDVNLSLGRALMGLRHWTRSQMACPPRPGSPAAARDVVTHSRVPDARDAVLVLQPRQDPPRRCFVGASKSCRSIASGQRLLRIEHRRRKRPRPMRRRHRQGHLTTHGPQMHRRRCANCRIDKSSRRHFDADDRADTSAGRRWAEAARRLYGVQASLAVPCLSAVIYSLSLALACSRARAKWPRG
jgi:hypothetical protein